MTTIGRRISLWGGPGCGKSKTSARLYCDLAIKMAERNKSVELVREWVKGWAIEKRKIDSFDQVFIFGNQMQEEDRLLQRGVDVIVTDSPIMMQTVYTEEKFKEPLEKLATEFDKKYPVLNILLNRKGIPYQKEGRYQTEEEAHEKDRQIIEIMTKYYPGDFYYFSPLFEYERIFSTVQEWLDSTLTA